MDSSERSYSQVASAFEPKQRLELRFVKPVSEGGRRVVRPPVEVVREGQEKWKNYLVGYFVKERLLFSVVSKLASKAWGHKGLTEVLGHENGFYFFRFDNGSACDDIVETSPWLFGESRWW